MKPILTLIRQNLYFFIPYLCLLLVGIWLLVNHQKGDVVLIINRNHNAWLNPVFKYATWLGDGLFFLAMIFFLAAFKLRNALLGFFTFIGMGVIIITLKKLIFEDYVRPRLFFEGQLEGLNFVEGVKVLSHHTFPSGHTATAFALFSLLALIYTNKKLGLLFVTLAALAGVSRMYLFQHFLVDVFVGSLIGVLVSLLVYHFAISSNRVMQSTVLNRSLISYILPGNGKG